MSSSDQIAKLVEKNHEFIDMFRELETEKTKRFDRFLKYMPKVRVLTNKTVCLFVFFLLFVFSNI